MSLSNLVICLFCNKPVTENQVICLNCGSQIKPLEVKYRLFWRKRSIILSPQKSFIYEGNQIEGKTREFKRKLRIPACNTTLDRWL
jgi:hypothetical protein